MSHDPIPQEEPAHRSHHAAKVQTYENVNHLPRAEREEMKALSLEVFGSSSKWKTIMDKGFMEKVTRIHTEHVPQEDGTKKLVETRVAVLNESGQEYSVLKFYGLAKLKELMLELREKKKEMDLAFQKQQDEVAQKVENEGNAKAIQAQAGGSAI